MAVGTWREDPEENRKLQKEKERLLPDDPNYKGPSPDEGAATSTHAPWDYALGAYAGYKVGSPLIGKANTIATGIDLAMGIDTPDNKLEQWLEWNKPLKTGVKATRLMLEKIFDQRVTRDYFDNTSQGLNPIKEYKPQMTGVDGFPVDTSLEFTNKPVITSDTFRQSTSRINTKLFDENELNAFLQASLDYKNIRQSVTIDASGNQLPVKKSVMKGFQYNGKSYITDKNNVKYSLVKITKPKNTTTRITEQLNYKLLSEYQIDDMLIRNSGWTKDIKKGTKEMQALRAELNKLRLEHPDNFYRSIMEYGDQAYIEHKIQRANSWFWNRKERDPGEFAVWLDAPNRNDVSNLRILFNDSFKRLKDSSERLLNNKNKKILDDESKYIIDFEDPMSGDFDRRSNPGNLVIKIADSGEELGYIPDYLQELYTIDFSTNFNNGTAANILKSKNIPEFYRLKDGEDLSKYRGRILEERIDLITNEAGNYSRTEIADAIQKDRSDFFELFADKLNWVQIPQWLKDQGLLEQGGKSLPPSPTRRYTDPFKTQKWKERIEKQDRAPGLPLKQKDSEVKIINTLNKLFPDEVDDNLL